MDKPLTLNNSHESNLIFIGYQIDKIDYKINPNFQFKEPLQVTFSLTSQIKTQDNEQKKGAVVTLTCSVFENADQNNYPFSLMMSLSGAFAFNGNIEEEGFLKFCKTSGTAILFPFLRSAVANITAAANIQPLMLPVINVHNFLGEYEKANEEPTKNDQPSGTT
jgi:preprotein translocase subunit SecB